VTTKTQKSLPKGTGSRRLYRPSTEGEDSVGGFAKPHQFIHRGDRATFGLIETSMLQAAPATQDLPALLKEVRQALRNIEAFSAYALDLDAGAE
jgi:hypothetical protein